MSDGEAGTQGRPGRRGGALGQVQADKPDGFESGGLRSAVLEPLDEADVSVEE